MKKPSIYVRLTLWYLLSVSVLLFICIGFMLYLNRKVTLESVQSRLVRVVEEVSKEMDTLSDMADATDSDDIYIQYQDLYIEIDDDYVSETDSVYTALYSQDHVLIYGNTPLSDNTAEKPAFSQTVKEMLIGSTHYYVYDAPVKSDVTGNLWIRGMIAQTQVRSDISKLFLMMAALLPVFMLLCLFLAHSMAKKALQPVERMRRTVMQISNGKDLSTRIDLGEGEDELHQLATVFNRMLDRLQASFAREQRFSSDASHELRTPMSVIVAECEYLSTETKDNPLSLEEYREGIVVIRRQASYMNEIIRNLLDFTRLGMNRYEKSLLDLSALLRDIGTDMQRLHQDEDVLLHMQIEEDVNIAGNKELIYRMLINIIDNAYRYGRQGGDIALQLYTEKDRACILVKDKGQGIAEEDLAHIFERFYRADSSRSSKGTGLGLSLSKEIAEWHGGDIQVESLPEKGSTFIISLPLIKL